MIGSSSTIGGKYIGAQSALLQFRYCMIAKATLLGISSSFSFCVPPFRFHASHRCVMIAAISA